MMENKEVIVEQPKSVMVSYGFGRATRQFVTMAFNAFASFFYVAEVGLNIWLVGLGFVIFGIWNAFNDPIIGYITNRPFKFNKKWGKWFPWTLIGGIPWIFTYILVFMPPNVDPVSGAWIIFGWLVFSTCLFDTFASIYDINFWSVAPNKFRTLKERRTAAGISVPVGVIGTTLGGVVPPLFVTYGVQQSYVVHGGIVVIGALVLLGLTIPGIREDKDLIERVLKRMEEKVEKESFFESFKVALRQKSFVIYMIVYMLFIALTLCVQASIPFLIRYSLRMKAIGQIFLQLAFLIGAVASIPLWVKYAQKTNNNKKVMLVAGVFTTIATLPLFFFRDLTGLFIAFLIWGIGVGGFWVMLTPTFSDVIDESVVRTGKHKEGVYLGIRQFFNRFAIVLQAVSFAIVQSMMGFEEGSETQSASAVVGIHINLGLIPAVFILIGALIWWKFYELTPDNVKINKAKLKELGL